MPDEESAPDTLAEALAEALRSVPVRPEDAAVVALARCYAAVVDAAATAEAQAVLAELGPKLLAVLVELGMTPRARAAVLGKGSPARRGERTKLDELRERGELRRVGDPAPADRLE